MDQPLTEFIFSIPSGIVVGMLVEFGVTWWRDRYTRNKLILLMLQSVESHIELLNGMIPLLKDDKTPAACLDVAVFSALSSKLTEAIDDTETSVMLDVARYRLTDRDNRLSRMNYAGSVGLSKLVRNHQGVATDMEQDLKTLEQLKERLIRFR